MPPRKRARAAAGGGGGGGDGHWGPNAYRVAAASIAMLEAASMIRHLTESARAAHTPAPEFGNLPHEETDYERLCFDCAHPSMKRCLVIATLKAHKGGLRLALCSVNEVTALVLLGGSEFKQLFDASLYTVADTPPRVVPSTAGRKKWKQEWIDYARLFVVAHEVWGQYHWCSNNGIAAAPDPGYVRKRIRQRNGAEAGHCTVSIPAIGLLPAETRNPPEGLIFYVDDDSPNAFVDVKCHAHANTKECAAFRHHGDFEIVDVPGQLALAQIAGKTPPKEWPAGLANYLLAHSPEA
jgi:hypothetical protein